MKNLILMLAALGLVAGANVALSNPQEDQERWQNYFKSRFPNVPEEDFVNGVYSIDPVGRENWEAIEEFPPYETALSGGEEMWNTPFANGKTYKDCFPDGPAVAGKYPYWDK